VIGGGNLIAAYYTGDDVGIRESEVTEKAVVIPSKLLKGIKEVDIRRRNGVIVVVRLGRRIRFSISVRIR
jgi:hypothetical protein